MIECIGSAIAPNEAARMANHHRETELRPSCGKDSLLNRVRQSFESCKQTSICRINMEFSLVPTYIWLSARVQVRDSATSNARGCMKAQPCESCIASSLGCIYAHTLRVENRRFHGFVQVPPNETTERFRLSNW